ncbi:MAG: hypothetical protein AAGF81_12295 [Pseudomonadota bacterium]
MRDIFLGKLWHWALVVIVAALMAWAGSARAHVIHFNVFLIALVIGSLLIIFLILKTHRAGEQVTREPLLSDDEEDTAHEQEGGGT